MPLRDTPGTAQLAKIDDAETDGLDGTYDSLAYRIAEVERHLHSNERWFGLAGTPNGEVHRADPMGTTVTPFQADAGNNTWGNWLQILGSSDTPIDAGKAYYDLHRLMIVAVERANSTHLIQLAYGTSGADALTAGTYTEFVYKPAGVTADEYPLVVQMRRAAAGTKGWLRLFVPGQNTGTFDFWIGLHEYEG